MTKSKEVVIARFDEVEGTEILITSVDGHQGRSLNMLEAIQKLVCDKYGEDWKSVNAICRLPFKDLVKQYGIVRKAGVRLPVGYPGGVYEEIKERSPIIITYHSAAQGYPSGALYSYTAVYGDQKVSVTRGSSYLGIIDILTELGFEVERGRTVEYLVAEHDIRLETKLDPSAVIDKDLKEVLTPINNNTPDEEPKVTKQKEQRIKLNIIDIEPNGAGDWVFTIDGVGTRGEVIPRTKFIATSRNNSSNSLRTDPRIVIAGVLPSICSLTDDQLIALRTDDPAKFISNIDWAVGDTLKRGFPKNNAGAAILNFLGEIEKVSGGDILDTLVAFMFNQELKWDPDMQMVRNMSGVTSEGAETQFRVVHAVGGFFAEGAIEMRKIRIFKDHSTVQIYTTPHTHKFDKETHCKTFTTNHPEQVLEFLRGISEVQTHKFSK